jgi:hypothetical protein
MVLVSFVLYHEVAGWDGYLRQRGAGYLTRPERLNFDIMFSITSQSKPCDGVIYPVALRLDGMVISVSAGAQRHNQNVATG